MFFFFFNDTATTEIYTLSLHDALPISVARGERRIRRGALGKWGAVAGRVHLVCARPHRAALRSCAFLHARETLATRHPPAASCGRHRSGVPASPASTTDCAR